MPDAHASTRREVMRSKSVVTAKRDTMNSKRSLAQVQDTSPEPKIERQSAGKAVTNRQQVRKPIPSKLNGATKQDAQSSREIAKRGGNEPVGSFSKRGRTAWRTIKDEAPGERWKRRLPPRC